MHWMLRRPLLALLVLAACVLVPAPVLLTLKLDNAPEVYFPADSPAVIFDRAVREQFPQDQVLVAVFGTPELFEPVFLERLDALVKSLEGDSRVERVASVTNTDHIRATEDGFAVEPLVDPDALGMRSADEWRERVLADPFAPGLIAARDASVIAVVLRPAQLDDSLQRLALERLLRDSISAYGLDDALAAVAGHVALDVAQLRAMITDLATLVPATLAVGLLLLWWLFRRLLVVALALATISAVAGLAVAGLGLAGKPFTLISSILPPLLTALTVAMLMHLFSAVAQARRHAADADQAMRQALTSVAKPIWFTALTTAAGLLSLTVSPIRPIETLGFAGAFGVGVAALITLYVLPALILRFDHGEWREAGLKRIERWTVAVARVALRRAGWVVAGFALLLALAIPQITKIEVETDLYAFFDDAHEITRATRYVEERLAGVMALEIVFDGDGPDSLMEPERLAAIRDVQRWLAQRPEVDHTLSLPDLVAEMHWAFNEEDPDFRSIPDNAALVAQYLFIYDGRDLFDLVDRDFSRTRLQLNLNTHGSGELNAFMGEVREYLATHPPADLEWDIAGMGRLFADQERLLIQGQLHGLLAVIAMVFLLMLWMWRSVPVALASMAPNLAPILFIFALMGVLGIWLDTATAMIASVAVGIALDDTIHVLHGYLTRRRAGASMARAFLLTYRHSGRAVSATTLVLCAQFVLMAFSAFQPTNAFGLLTAFGLVVALVFDLLLLPALFVVASRCRSIRNA